MTDTVRGVWYMALATLLFSLMTVFVKLVPGIPPLEIIFFRAVISVALCFWGLKRARVSIFGNNKTMLMMRGVAGVIALTLNFYLIQEIPLATASTLTYLAPVATTIIGIWFVKEKVSPTQFLFFAISFAGILVIQGFDARVSLFHLIVGIITSVFMGLAYNCVRKLSTTEHPLVIIFYFPFVCLPVAGLWCLLFWVQPAGWQWFFLLMVGITSQVAQYFMTRAYQLATISTVSIVNYTGIIYAIFLGYILFGEGFNLMTYAGMSLVLAGVILNVVRKNSHKIQAE
ncbi:MAG: DMT family transporter [Gammaproteobacteria bacterium]|nr:DMT family transporter [Gammaproteobacteria bacterium]